MITASNQIQVLEKKRSTLEAEISEAEAGYFEFADDIDYEHSIGAWKSTVRRLGVEITRLEGESV